jgi:hypothetical protein
MQKPLTTRTLNLIAKIPYEDLADFGAIVAHEIKHRYVQHEIEVAKKFKHGDEVQFKHGDEHITGTIVEVIKVPIDAPNKTIKEGTGGVVFRILSDDKRKFVVPASIMKKQKVIK